MTVNGCLWEKNEKKMVLCLLTYNRAETVRTFIEKEIDVLREADIDLIVYDSSELDETKNIVETYNFQGYGNLYYKKTDSRISANVKFFNIAANINSTYEYVWLSHDHTVFESGAVKYLLECLNGKPDFIYLRKQCLDYKCVIENDRNEFAMKAAWQLGRFGAAIIRNDTFLKKIDWEKMSLKYLTDKRLNFSQIGLYLEQLSLMDNPHIMTVEFPRETFYDLFRFEKASWDNETIRICLESWGEVISALPDSYTDKVSLLQTIDKYFLSKNKIVELKRTKQYDLKSYFKYKKWIRLIVPEMKKDFLMAAVLPCGFLQWINSRKTIYKIKNACRQGQKICIYGAGKHGMEYAQYLLDCKIKVDGILVTSTKGNPVEISSIPVYPASEYLSAHPAFVIIAVAKEYQEEIVKYLNNFYNSEYECIAC